MIKIVDFQKTEKIDPSFKDANGLYVEETDTIYIHVGLGARRIPSRKEVLLHEKAHQKIRLGGVSKYFTDDQEECFCDLWAIMLYKRSGIHGLEKRIRDDLEQGGSLRSISKRDKVIRNMLRFCGVKPTPSLVNALL